MLKQSAMIMLCVISLGIYAADSTQSDNYQQQISQLQEEMKKMTIKMQ